MKKENKSEKVCPCGRIITDPNNKSGLCPKCQKIGAIGGVTLGVAGAGLGIKILAKKYGDKIIKGAVDVVRNIIKL
jgi:hypothetical protein